MKAGGKFVMVARIWSMPEAPVDSTIVKCTACGQSCWLAKSSVDRVRRMRLRPACTQCVSGNVDKLPLTAIGEETAEEVRRVLGEPNLSREDMLATAKTALEILIAAKRRN